MAHPASCSRSVDCVALATTIVGPAHGCINRTLHKKQEWNVRDQLSPLGEITFRNNLCQAKAIRSPVHSISCVTAKWRDISETLASSEEMKVCWRMARFGQGPLSQFASLALASRTINRELKTCWGWKSVLEDTPRTFPMVISGKGARGGEGFGELQDELEAADSSLPEEMLDPRRFPETAETQMAGLSDCFNASPSSSPLHEKPLTSPAIPFDEAFEVPMMLEMSSDEDDEEDADADLNPDTSDSVLSAEDVLHCNALANNWHASLGTRTQRALCHLSRLPAK
jgi:hypothetical protein